MAIDFDGTNDYIDCGSDASIDNIFDGGGAVEFWFYFDTNKTNNIICMAKGDAHENVNTGWIIYANITDDNIYFEHGWSTLRGSWNSNASTLTDDTWHHIAILYDKGATTNNPTIYIDGVSTNVNEANTPNGTVANDSGSSLVLAAATYNGTGYYGDTFLEEGRIFSSTITLEQITPLAAGFRGPVGNEAAWWDMCSAHAVSGGFDGATLAVDTNYLSDLSSNSNTGNPTNDPVGAASRAPKYGHLLVTTFIGLKQAIAGTLVLAGSLQTLALWKRFYGGLLSLSGDMAWKRLLSLSGVLDFSSIVTIKIKKFLGGTLTFSSTVISKFIRFVIATVKLCLKPVAVVRAWLDPDADVDIV